MSRRPRQTAHTPYVPTTVISLDLGRSATEANANGRQYSAEFLMQLADETNRSHGVPIAFDHSLAAEPIPSLQSVAGVARNWAVSGQSLSCEVVCLEAGRHADALRQLLDDPQALQSGFVKFVPTIVQRGKQLAINGVSIVKTPESRA